MKKYMVIVSIMMLIMMTSCNKEETDDTVKIWMYRQDGANPGSPYEQIRQMIEDEITNYAEEHNIEIKFSTFKDSELSLADYVLKRNLALEQGSVDIIIDDMRSDLYQASEYAGDYTKLSNYEKIFDNFQGQYCIPICSQLETLIVDRDVLEMYGIVSEKYITLSRYYEIKQLMKENGAKFKLNETEYDQLSLHYIAKNDLCIKNDGDKFILDRNLTLQTITDVADDLLKYYDLKNIYASEDSDTEESIFDASYGRVFSLGRPMSLFFPLKFDRLIVDDKSVPFDNYIIVICDDIERQFMRNIPCMLINKNTDKNGTYEVADYLLSDIFQGRVYSGINPFSTITESPGLKERLQYDADWNYQYVPGKINIYNGKLGRQDIDEIIGVVSDTYKMFKNIDTEKYFEPYLWLAVLNLVSSESLKMTQNPNYAEDEFDKNIDDFILNLNVSFN